jgi:dienelactone hydrolase
VLDLARGGADVRAVVSMHGVLDALPAELVAPSIRARVLICDGARDPLNTAAARADCASQLRDAGADCEVVSFANAAHGFTCPAQALNLADGFDYDPDADARSWALARDFLARALSPVRPDRDPRLRFPK